MFAGNYKAADGKEDEKVFVVGFCQYQESDDENSVCTDGN